MNQKIRTFFNQRWPELLVALIFFIVYVVTLQPGILPGDAGEFQLVVPTLGVAHPPGYPLYILLGKLFTVLVPIGEMAWRVNLFSAVTSSFTLLIVFWAVQALLPKRHVLAGLLAMSVLGISTTFWAQATTANIRSLTALFTALMLWMFIRYANAVRAGNSQLAHRYLVWLALVTSLGVLHHASLAFIGLVLIVGVFAVDSRLLTNPKRWWQPILAGVLPLLILLYLPWRGNAGAVLASPTLATWDGFLDHVLARGFGSDMFYYVAWQDFVPRLPILTNIYDFQFGRPLLIVSLIGLGILTALRWRMGLLLIVAIAVHSWVAITYRAPQTVEYLLPAYVALLIALGSGIAFLLQSLPERLRLGAAGLITVLIAVLGQGLFQTNWQGYRFLAQDTSTQTYVANILESAPENTAVFANWHWATPIWYQQTVVGQRKDLNVQYVVPQGESLAWNWADRVANTPGGIVTSFYPAEYAATGKNLVPFADAWQVAADDSVTTIANGQLVGAAFDDRWLLTEISPVPTQIQAGTTLDLTLGWQSLGQPEVISFFVQLLGPDGIVYAQNQQSYQAGPYAQGDTLVNRYRLSIAPYAPQGDHVLIIGAVRPDGTRLKTENGEDFLRLQNITLTESQASIATEKRDAASYPVQTASEYYVTLGGLITLTDVAADVTGNRVTIDASWQATQPLTKDIVMRVDLVAADNSWRLQSDFIPAGGAIPTLKWLPGHTIHDYHQFEIPDGADLNGVRVELMAYDHFTNERLALNDPWLAREGIVIPVMLDQIRK